MHTHTNHAVHCSSFTSRTQFTDQIRLSTIFFSVSPLRPFRKSIVIVKAFARLARARLARPRPDNMATVKLFEQVSHASLYSKYRPTYPKSLLEILSNYITRNGSGSELAVDVACGSGQSTFHLLDHFKQCIGVDISRAQVDEAQKKSDHEGHKNVRFLEGDATKLPVEPTSVDFITLAQAWHWLPDVDKFYFECKRVLKPSGCLAVYGYGNVQVLNDSCNSLVRNFYENILKGCWHKERRHIDDEYAEVVLPFTNTERHDIEMTKTFSLADFIGYVSSWSGYQKYCELNPDNNTLQTLQEKLTESLDTDSGSVSLETKFPVFVMLGQK